MLYDDSIIWQLFVWAVPWDYAWFAMFLAFAYNRIDLKLEMAV